MTLLKPYLAAALEETAFTEFGERYRGKVRDVYRPNERERILIATDRQSAFDVLWCTVPLKGQVLNQISRWWFERVSDVMPTQVIATPDPNTMIVKNLRMIPLEIVVRGYMTGSTSTSVWMNYQNGVRRFCGNDLPEGMKKNEAFPSPILTPNTKGEHSDDDIDAEGIVANGIATTEQWQEIEQKAFALFARGQAVAAERGLILVDTKYEMGYDEHGTLTIADEVHTPDSSRYWVAASYVERTANGQEPESLDKEFFRLWLREQGFEYGGPQPAISDEIRLQLAAKYIDLYERITGESFLLPEATDTARRIERNLQNYYGRE